MEFYKFQNVFFKNEFMFEELEIALTLYDEHCRKFLGKTLHLPKTKVTSTENTSVINVNCAQSIYYFATASSSPSAVMCLEVIGFLPNSGGCSSIGWTVIRRTPGTNVPKGLKKSDLYRGTPRALLFMETPCEKNPHLQKTGIGCQVTYTVKYDESEKIQRFLPENTLTNALDVPGYEREGSKEFKPRKSIPLFLDRIQIRLKPSLDEFEKELCNSINEEHNKSQGNLKSEKGIIVIERRLTIGVHNGLRYLRTPQIAHLLTEQHRSSDKSQLLLKRTKSASSINDSKFDDEMILCHHNRVKLLDLHPTDTSCNLEVVFLLEYVVSTKIEGDVGTNRAGKWVDTVAVKIGTWKPNSNSTSSSSVNIDLKGGPMGNPDSLLIYRSLFDGKISFRFSWKSKTRALSLIAMESKRFETSKNVGDSFNFEDSNTSNRNSTNLSVPRRHTVEDSQPHAKKAKSTDIQPKVSFTNEFLQEIETLPGPHLPVVAEVSSLSCRSAHVLSRTAYAKLYATGLAPILDRHGKPPDIIVPFKNFILDDSKEENDLLKCNVITFQFLAYSLLVVKPGDFSNDNYYRPKTIIIAFQFLHYLPFVSERLILGNLESGLSNDPKVATYLLRRMTADGLIKKGPSGFEVKYYIDPATDNNGSNFARNLSNSSVFIDVWDGESLLHIGSTFVTLSMLCRQGREAVQVTYELDVVYLDYKDQVDDHSSPSDTVSTIKRGTLHLRMANVGYPFNPDRNNTGQCISGRACPMPSKNVVISSSESQKSLKENKVSRAKSFWETEKSLSYEVENFQQSDDIKPEVYSVERSRKLSRMAAVRASNLSLSPDVTIDTDKAEPEKNLRLLEALRDRTKTDTIHNLLMQSMGGYHSIFPTVGTVEFFEFELINPLSAEQLVSVEFEDSDLSLITDAKEWHYFRRLSRNVEKLPPVEQNLFVFDKENNLPKLFLRQKEKVFIPFKFQCEKFTCEEDQVLMLSRPSHFRDNSCIRQQGSRMITVLFKTADGKVLTSLHLQVQIQPPEVDKIFRFQHSENSFLKRFIRFMPKDRNYDIQYQIGCSDTSVIADLKQTSSIDPVDVLIKVPCGSSGSMRTFWLFVYNDLYRSFPCNTWKIFVQALQRVDVSCIKGHTIKQALFLRGTSCTRLVKCYSSHPIELSPEPCDPFLLEAGAVHELKLKIKSNSTGKRFIYINIIDTEILQVLFSYMICLTYHSPVITRSFQIHLPLGGGKGSNKRISYSNPYPVQQIFHLSTDRPDLLRFKEAVFRVEAKSSFIIGLIFMPCHLCDMVNILVFINTEDGKNEETFSVKVLYS